MAKSKKAKSLIDRWKTSKNEVKLTKSKKKTKREHNKII